VRGRQDGETAAGCHAGEMGAVSVDNVGWNLILVWLQQAGRDLHARSPERHAFDRTALRANESFGCTFQAQAVDRLNCSARCRLGTIRNGASGDCRLQCAWIGQVRVQARGVVGGGLRARGPVGYTSPARICFILGGPVRGSISYRERHGRCGTDVCVVLGYM